MILLESESETSSFLFCWFNFDLYDLVSHVGGVVWLLDIDIQMDGLWAAFSKSFSGRLFLNDRVQKCSIFFSCGLRVAIALSVQ
jgi:hypothetical protein